MRTSSEQTGARRRAEQLDEAALACVVTRAQRLVLFRRLLATRVAESRELLRRRVRGSFGGCQLLLGQLPPEVYDDVRAFHVPSILTSQETETLVQPLLFGSFLDVGG